MSAITRFLPKNHLSYFIGKLVHIRLPSFINKFIIANFAKAYHIRLEDAEFPYDQYPSLGEFFIRHLKPGIRPVASAWAVHPADSVITQAAVITGGKLIQAKNKTYSLDQFTKDPNAMAKWDQGTFLTYYLCPTDYHRVHSPVTGTIKKVRHIPGALWPVNAWSTENIHEMFSINERVLVEIETDRGPVGVMFVGATNVGHIILAFDETIIGNQLLSSAILEKEYSLPVKKGDELGAFRMGSTVVMLYPKGALDGVPVANYLNQQVQVSGALS
ncbi:MAG: phosphatidylserine decarboxylase [Bdellovibrio sp.]|nr:phosphatidylserine decarboxylase [Bdellovibrio sp.]